MGGYALIHRSLIGHAAFRNESETMLFAWMVLKAAWRPTRVRYKGHSINLKRGQLAVSVRDMAEAHDRNKNWISRVLNTMRAEDMIATSAGTGVLVITVCNYDEYQPEGAEGGTALGTPAGTAQGTRAGQRRDTEQEENNINKHIPRARTKQALPDDWEPGEFGEATQSRSIVAGWSRTEFERQLESFRAHHRKEGSKFVDWQSAWSTWVLNSARFAERDQRPPGQPVHRSNGGAATGSTLVDTILADEARRQAAEAQQ